MLDISKSIPTNVEFPSVHDFDIDPHDEELMSLTDAGFHVSSQYYKQGIAGSYPDCYARESVVKMLKTAQRLLPNGLHFKIYDAYRPVCVQQRLWNFYRAQVIANNSELSEEEIDRKTAFYVSRPSFDEMHPTLHSTGGAIDLTLETKDGYALNMGTLFDDFTDRAWTNHFEEYERADEVKNNRRLLYNVMIEAGFVNLPSEWWHYSYGDKFWAYFKNETSIYKGIIDANFPNRFPLI